MIQVNRINENGFYIEPVIIEDGQEIPEDCIVVPVPEGFHHPRWDSEAWEWVEGKPPSLDDIKTQKIAELNAQCEAAILGGFVASNGHIFGFNVYDQMNFTQQGTLLQLDSSISSVGWKTEDAGIVTFTKDEFIAILKDAEAHKRSNIGRYWMLKAQIQAATNTTTIDAIVW